ncbi:MAG TPA: hypothetical protein VH684_26915, partial [Xanthobacteraceae bacterium]
MLSIRRRELITLLGGARWQRRCCRTAFNITALEPRIVMPQLSSKFSRLPVLAMVLLGLCAKAPLAGADPLVLKAGIAEPSNSDLAWWMADVGGFFAEQGLKVEFI